MKELLELSFTPANLLATICLMLVMVYWLVFLVGLLDLSFLDMDLSQGHEFEVDHDVHAGKEIGKDLELTHHHDGFGWKILGFLNLGHVPFMVIFSFFALFFWVISILGNHYVAGGNGLLNAAVIVGGIFGGALMAKFITQPLRAFFKKLYVDEVKIDLRGKICEIQLGPEGDRLGQAILQIKDKSLTINVKSDGGLRIPPNVKCVILEKFEEDEYYLVSPLDEAPDGS